jgi:hypothetical protein
MTSPSHPIENPYPALRYAALHRPASELGSDLAVDGTGVYGLVMDWRVDASVVTLAAYLTGDASLYGGGGGAISGFTQDVARRAVIALVAEAKAYRAYFPEAQDFVLPRKGMVGIYLLRIDRIGFASAPHALLHAGTHDLCLLWSKAQQVAQDLSALTKTP